MPTYGYVCAKCGHAFDKFQSMKDEPLSVCPKELCHQKRWGKGKVKRQMGTGAGMIFKGSGFYITDYRSEGYKAAAKKDTNPAPAAPATPAASTPSEKKSSSSETKPAKKS
jgi:putative FmdB family regulatory protein